ncbi:putative membrane protein [Nocardioidaceae bacterium Broad-1]|nr:putative membrane protein [Nocardioidaceae bacterium Broad-1]
MADPVEPLRFSYSEAMTSIARTVARLLLGVAMTGTGVAHLTTQRQEFRAQVPSWFPIDEDLTVLGSGVVEIGLGLAFVALPARRRLVGALLAAFFVAIFPGNIAQYVEGVDAFGLDTDGKRLIRLFFQPVLVVWALFGGGWLRRSRDD